MNQSKQKGQHLAECGQVIQSYIISYKGRALNLGFPLRDSPFLSYGDGGIRSCRLWKILERLSLIVMKQILASPPEEVFVGHWEWCEVVFSWNLQLSMGYIFFFSSIKVRCLKTARQDVIRKVNVQAFLFRAILGIV